MNAALTLWNKQMSKLSGEETFGLLIQPILWVLLFGVGMTSIIPPTSKAMMAITRLRFWGFCIRFAPCCVYVYISIMAATAQIAKRLTEI